MVPSQFSAHLRQPKIALWSSTPAPCGAAAAPPAPAPGCGALDLIVLLDGSGSIDAASFELARAFVKSVVGAMPVGEGGTRVGLAQIGTPGSATSATSTRGVSAVAPGPRQTHLW